MKSGSKKGGLFGGLVGAAKGAAKGGSPGGMSSGLYRVTSHGDIIKVSQKRRKKGFRTPVIVKKMMEQQDRQMTQITNALMVAALK